MNKQPSDEQIDQIMRTLMNEAAVDENTVDEIADSPTLWWAVQRQIAAQKAEVKAPWPPSIWRRIFLFATPVAAAILVFAFFAFRTTETEQNIAKSERYAVSNTPADASTPEQTRPYVESVTPAVRVLDNRERTTAKPAHVVYKTPVRQSLKNTLVAKTTKASEYKSEFIALSYAGNADSGQLVRVKVPSSMMVSLGLVSSVNKSSDLVDAEVIVGDDGLTRAIRFIR